MLFSLIHWNFSSPLMNESWGKATVARIGSAMIAISDLMVNAIVSFFFTGVVILKFNFFFLQSADGSFGSGVSGLTADATEPKI